MAFARVLNNDCRSVSGGRTSQDVGILKLKIDVSPLTRDGRHTDEEQQRSGMGRIG